MKKGLNLLVMPVCLLALTMTVVSCTSLIVSGLEVSTTEPNTSRAIGNLDIEVEVVKFLGYSAGPTLANVYADASDPAVINAIKAEVKKMGGTRAVNVKIVEHATALDIILNGFTGGIYSPTKVRVTGTVLR
jgi:hypothetical protein